MKKLSVIVVAMMMAVSTFAADSNEVTSVNAVGFIRTDLAGGEWYVVSLPLNRLDGEASITLEELFPTAGSSTEAWYYEGNSWVGAQYVTGVGWFPVSARTKEFIRGDAIFMKAADGGAGDQITVLGEVPDSRTAPTTDVDIYPEWTLVGYAYPTDMKFTDTTLAQNASNADEAWFWDSDAETWTGMQYVTGAGWFPVNLREKVLNAGEGFFYRSQSASTVTWTETKPYDM